jgi:hypothetical protein
MLKLSLLLLAKRSKNGTYTPFGTDRYSVNFDDVTSVWVCTPTTALPPLVLVGAVCALAFELATRIPMATNAETFIARFMGYLTKNAPEGELEPWMLRWHLVQARPMNREFTVGYPEMAPSGACGTPFSVE